MNIRIPAANVNPLPAAITPIKQRENEQSEKINKNVTVAKPAEDSVVLNSGGTTELTYADPRVNKSSQKPDVEALLEESNRKAQEIINLILPLVEQQGLNLAKVVSGEQKLTADPETIAAAKAAIGPDGEFGVRKTAERILSFAKGAIGGDASKLDKIRAAVERGFKEAADILGGALPEISQQTLSAIEAEFDRWKAEGIPTGDTVKLSVNSTPAKAAG
jgi:hypothetical protein